MTPPRQIPPKSLASRRLGAMTNQQLIAECAKLRAKVADLERDNSALRAKVLDLQYRSRP